MGVGGGDKIKKFLDKCDFFAPSWGKITVNYLPYVRGDGGKIVFFIFNKGVKNIFSHEFDPT